MSEVNIYEYWKLRPKLHPNDAGDYLFAVTASDERHADRIFANVVGEDFDSAFFIRRQFRGSKYGLVFNPIGSYL